MITTNEAREIVFAETRTYGTELVGLHYSVGRVLAKDVYVDRSIPPFDRVSMDGIAIRYEDFAKGQSVFSIAGIAPAGTPRATLRNKNTCIEIMTGASLPHGADTIIPYEKLQKVAEQYQIMEDVVAYKNIHKYGSDLIKGQRVLQSDCIIRAADINVLASVGISEAEVKRMPSVGLISTGDELVPINQTPKDYQIRRSNIPMLQSKLTQLQIPSDNYHVPDELEKLVTKIDNILHKHDVLMMSGGVSKGKYDFIPEALGRLGFEQLFHKVKQRPGKPFWFGKKGEKLIFAFPGNPVSTLACFHYYFIPWLYQCLNISKNLIKARLSDDLIFKPNLTYFAHAKLRYNKEGIVIASVIKGNGSGDIVSPTKADGFLILPMSEGPHYPKGKVFDFLEY